MGRSRREPHPGAAAAARSLRDQAAALYASDAARARRLASRALDLARDTRDAEALGWAYRAMAEAALFSGRLKDSDDFYRRCREQWDRLPGSKLLGQLLVGHIHVLAHLGKIAEAKAAARRARGILSRHGDTLYLAKLAMNLGVMHFQGDRYPEALRECERAAGLFRRAGVRDPSVVSLEVNRAVALTQLDRHAEALELLESLEAEAEERGLDLLLAQIRMNAAYVHMQRANFKAALPLLGKATHYFRDTGHPAFLASCLVNRAEVYQHLQMEGDAVDLAAEAERLFLGEGMHYDAALAGMQHAACALALDDPRAASRSITRSRRRFRSEGNEIRAALADLIAAEAWLRRGGLASAERCLDRARAVFTRRRVPRWKTLVQIEAVELARRRGRAGPLQKELMKLRRILRSLPKDVYPALMLRGWEALGSAYEALDRSQEAETSYEEALRTFETVRRFVPTEETKLSFIRGRGRLFDRLVAMRLERSAPAEEILDLTDRARAQRLADGPERILAQVESGGRVASARAAKLAAAAESSRRHLSWLHGQLGRLEMEEGTPSSRLTKLRNQIARTEKRWRSHVRELWEERADTRGDPALFEEDLAASLSPAPRLEHVRRTLPPDWGFVSYYVSGDVAALVWVAGDRSGCVPLGGDLATQVGRLCDRLDLQWSVMTLETDWAASEYTEPCGVERARPADAVSRETTEEILRALHEIAWQPLERDLERQGVQVRGGWVVAPHGPTHRVPFHALRGRDGHLIDDLDFALVPSGRAWTDVRPSRRRRRAWLAGVRSAALPQIERELRAAARGLTGWQVERSLAPTRPQFLEAARRARHLHVATHGTMRSDNPAFSYLELSDGPLYVHDLEQVDLAGGSVVLSSCSSGRGERVAGDEWVGLATGFLQAGAGTVVTSLWPVEDAATRELMTHFYRELGKGTSASASLGNAIRRVKRRSPHPWRWAPFVVIGGVRR